MRTLNSSAPGARLARFALAAIVSTLAVACSDATGPVDAGSPQLAKGGAGGGGIVVPARLYFAAEILEPGNVDIYAINVDGTGLTRLTTAPGDDSRPTVSKDGKKIVFHSARTGQTQVFTMNTDGSRQTQITRRAGVIPMGASLSFDNKKIAYAAYADGSYGIFVANANGSGEVRLTKGDVDLSPMFSPTDYRIAFTHYDGTSEEIYVMNADGTGVTDLTHVGNPFVGMYAPAWSPQGDRIVFSSNIETPDEEFDLYSVSAAGGNVVRINSWASDNFDSRSPSYSPDGSRIVFGVDGPGALGIRILNADRTYVDVLTGQWITEVAWGR